MTIPLILYLRFDSWLPHQDKFKKQAHAILHAAQKSKRIFVFYSTLQKMTTNDVNNIEINILLSSIIEVLLGLIFPSEVLKQPGHGNEQNGEHEQNL